MPPLIAYPAAFLLLIKPLIGDSGVLLLPLQPLNADSAPSSVLLPPYFPCISLAFYYIFLIRQPYAAYAAFACRFRCFFRFF